MQPCREPDFGCSVRDVAYVSDALAVALLRDFSALSPETGPISFQCQVKIVYLFPYIVL